MRVRGLDQGADRRRRGVEDRDLMLVDRLPETTGIGVSRNAFEHNLGRANRERAISDVRVSGDPANIGRAPEDVGWLDVECPAHGEHRPPEIASGAVLHALWLT